MHLYERKPLLPAKGIVVTVLVFIAVIVLFTSLLGNTGETADREQAALLENAIRSAAVTSYAIEGHYPATVDEIVEHYGVIIDEERFIVRYDIFAPNVMPTISVIFKGEYAQ